MSSVLVTGFEPFGGASVNASWEAVRRLPLRIRNADIHRELIPCTFAGSASAVHAALERHRPDVVVCVGEAGSRTRVSIERVAVNLDDARIPDNAGQQPLDAPIDAAGPAAYFSRMPVKACALAVDRSGVPAEVSLTAGSYVCNHVFYRLMRMLEKELPHVVGGFVHVPRGETIGPDAAERALRAIIETVLERGSEDLPLRGGRED
ncbi:pyroglutamyl-peptidase I Cysteine peptidase. MEROPS family C15 [Paramicrobacterium humi]|uniref:Pyroglutamyl-peptidase I n=1 Tax=Paramicrobacterium humi TaxID=640635 RepID=A0A1H4QXT1_9MICO|nr:pyroglutamyl-peptidase I [Microbacterium humi]SEC24392.1 pyroglutamyl-peptidase I Cysteine peptidase. MEROPS family C15 [Microbacterium humi]